MGYKKLSRRQIQKGGGIEWTKSKLGDGTVFWYESGEPSNIVFENPWVRGDLDDGTKYWYERANPSNIVFINPELKGFSPSVVIIAGSPLINGVNINGIYEQTVYFSYYPNYVHRTNNDLGIIYCDGSDTNECPLMNDEKKPEWQLYTGASGETDTVTPLAYISGEYGGLADCLLADPVWKVKKGDNIVAEPRIKTLFGCSDEEKDPKCDFVKSKLNGGKRSLIKQIRKRRYSRK